MCLSHPRIEVLVLFSSLRKVKVKQSFYMPAQTLVASRIPRYSAHECGKIVSPPRRPPSPQKTSLVLIRIRGMVDPRTIVRPERLTFSNLASYIQDGRKITLQMPHFIFIQQISILNILIMPYNLLFFSLQNAVYFIMLPCLVSVLLTF